MKEPSMATDKADRIPRLRDYVVDEETGLSHQIPNEAVEAHARLLFSYDIQRGRSHFRRVEKWEDQSDATRDEFRSESLDLLEATYPAIREAVLVEVERKLTSDAAARAVIDAVGCYDGEAREMLNAALATLKEEGGGSGAEGRDQAGKSIGRPVDATSGAASTSPEEGPRCGGGRRA